jgi:hypothetical protein
MTDVLAAVEDGAFVEFGRLFRPEEGRMGVTVTFVAVLELVREGLLELVQTEAYGPLHVRASQAPRLRIVDGGTPVDTGAIDNGPADNGQADNGQAVNGQAEAEAGATAIEPIQEKGF